MYKKYHVKLTRRQRNKLRRLTGKGECKARQLNRARVLLLSDECRKKGPKTDVEISEILNVSLPTVHRIRLKFSEDGLTEALEEKPRSGRPKLFSGKDAAHVTALACSDPPCGYGRWSMRLLADKVVELGYLESISYKTVSNILKTFASLETAVVYR
jgi:transposase